MASSVTAITGEAAGVPFIAAPPVSSALASPPVVVTWHLNDPPRSETAMAAAIPLDGLDAWRIYLGSPMSGSRLPNGSLDEFMQLGAEDAVRNLYGPITDQAAEEFPAAFAVLRDRLGFAGGPVAVLGGSQGAATALRVVAEGTVPIAAMVLVSPLVQLRPVVEAVGRQFGITYPWDEGSERIADRMDFLVRAGEIAKSGQPATLIVVGADDDDAILKPAAALQHELAERYDDDGRIKLVSIPGMEHALAEEPGLEPAAQTPHAAEVDRHAVAWLRQHLLPAR